MTAPDQIPGQEYEYVVSCCLFAMLGVFCRWSVAWIFLIPSPGLLSLRFISSELRFLEIPAFWSMCGKLTRLVG